MSKISLIADALLLRVRTVFPNHFELQNARNIDFNDAISLKKGVGLCFGPAINTYRELGCSDVSINREIIITITTQVLGHERDNMAKIRHEKILLENQYDLLKAIEADPTLTNLAVNATYVSDTGIADIYSDDGTFLMLQSLIKIEYFDEI